MEPLSFDREALRRLPLAESVLLVLQQAALPEHCLDLFDRLRDRCYTRKLSFDLFVALIRDALLHHHGSARPALEAARLQGLLPTSNQSVYGKLKTVPLALSEAFLGENSQRLRPLLPADLPSPVPASLRSFRVEVFDGKVTKRVAKKLKVLRGLSGGALGGKGLVALNLNTGLVTALAACADGDANDASLVPSLVGQVRPRVPAEQAILWVGDSQFANLVQPTQLQGEEPHGRRDHFLIRYSSATPFTPDPEADQLRAHPALAEGIDAQGRRYRQEWGWLGAASNRRRRYVRRILVERPGEAAVVVVTDLLDPQAYPAEDLLTCYLQRGGIEGVFQKITEVFGLQHLIASTPKGTVFQLAWCLLLYNVVVVVCGHLAAGQQVAAEAVSKEMVFRDLREEVAALVKLVPEPERLGALLPVVEQPPAQVRRRLRVLLAGLWRPIWRKTTNKKRRPHPDKPHGRVHCSVHRVLEEHKHQQRSQSSTNSS
jgi:hypothetical protein